MTTVPVRQERRAAQRFEFNLPVFIRADGREYRGCTQDLSGRGVFLLLDSPLPQDCHVELLVSMPAEVTLTETMRVSCRGRVLRVQPSGDGGKFAIAICLESYTYLPAAHEDISSDSFGRIACLHCARETAEPEPSRIRS